METHPVRSRRESIINPDLLTHWGRGGAGRVTDLSPSSGLWVKAEPDPSEDALPSHAALLRGAYALSLTISCGHREGA